MRLIYVINKALYLFLVPGLMSISIDILHFRMKIKSGLVSLSFFSFYISPFHFIRETVFRSSLTSVLLWFDFLPIHQSYDWLSYKPRQSSL